MFLQKLFPFDHVIFTEFALAMQIFLYDGHFLFVESLLSLFVEFSILTHELLLIGFVSDSDLNIDLTRFLVGLRIVNFEPINNPFDITALFS